MPKILITSCDTTPDGGRAQNRKMLKLYEMSDKSHELTKDPHLADFILICDATWENYGEKIRDNDLIKSFPNKCFILSNLASPFYYTRGILTNTEKSVFHLNRFRSCSYTAYYDPYHNPYIAEHNAHVSTIQREYLFSFVGRNCHPIRDAIFKVDFKRKDIIIKDTTAVFDLWNGSLPDKGLQEEYYSLMLRSKFVLCPRGVGANSIRLFEAMKLGLSPIIISDDFLLPQGPNWEDFSIIIKEREVAYIEAIVEGYEHRYLEMGLLARKNYEQYFAEKNYFNYIIENIISIAEDQIIPEVFFHRMNDLLILFKRGVNFLPNRYYSLKKYLSKI